MSNISYIWQPKYLSPFGDGKVYLLPAKKDQHCINGYAYIAVCCSPSYNGIYRVPEEVYSHARTFINHKLPCWAINIEDCELYLKLDQIQNPKIKERIAKEQEDYKKFRKKSK